MRPGASTRPAQPSRSSPCVLEGDRGRRDLGPPHALLSLHGASRELSFAMTHLNNSFTHTHSHTQTQRHTHIHTHIYTQTHRYTQTHAHRYTHADTHRDTHPQPHTDTHSHRYTQTQTDRHARTSVTTWETVVLKRSPDNTPPQGSQEGDQPGASRIPVRRSKGLYKKSCAHSETIKKDFFLP